MFRTKLLTVLFAIALTGCATSFLDRSIEQGDYFAAYTVAQKSDKDARKSISEKLLQISGGASSDKFFKSAQKDIGIEHRPGASFFVDTMRYFDLAVQDGLLSQEQSKALRVGLINRLNAEVIRDPKLLDYPVLVELAGGAGKTKADLALDAMKRLPPGETLSFKPMIPYYVIIKNEGKADKTQEAEALVKAEIAKNLDATKGQLFDFGFIQEVLIYVELSGDRSLDFKISDFIASSRIQKSDLPKIGKLYPDLAAKLARDRAVTIDIKTNGDEFLAGEIGDALKAYNSWITIDPDSPRKLNLARLRFNEQRSGPNNATQIVSNPSFGTLLLIPKNASVMFDYSTTELALRWNFTAQDSLTKKTITLSGDRKAKKIECRNVRYRNVFGGEGAIDGWPSSEAVSFCTSTQQIDFDYVKSQLIKEIAVEIAEKLLLNQTPGYTVTRLYSPQSAY